MKLGDKITNKVKTKVVWEKVIQTKANNGLSLWSLPDFFIIFKANLLHHAVYASPPPLYNHLLTLILKMHTPHTKTHLPPWFASKPLDAILKQALIAYTKLHPQTYNYTFTCTKQKPIKFYKLTTPFPSILHCSHKNKLIQSQLLPQCIRLPTIPVLTTQNNRGGMCSTNMPC